MTEPGEETKTLPPQAAMPQPQGGPGRPRGLRGTIWVLEHAQDHVAGVVGVVLIFLAAPQGLVTSSRCPGPCWPMAGVTSRPCPE